MKTSKTDLPADDLGHLEEAFNKLGEHKFGAQWPSDMSERVRLGSKQSKSVEDGEADILSMGGWALSALEQCVQNGWLPLMYFVGGRRIWYFSSSGEPPLHALYPRPTDHVEGQIELVGGGIHHCMVDLRCFSQVLRAKFGERQKRGRERGYEELDAELDSFFDQNPIETRKKDVIAYVNAALHKSAVPARSTLYQRIDEAVERAKAKSAKPIPD